MIVIPLPVSLDPKSSMKVAAELLEHLGHDVQLDATELSKVHTTGIEMLVAARKQWKEAGVQFEIARLSDEVREMLGVIGFEPGLHEIGAEQ